MFAELNCFTKLFLYLTINKLKNDLELDKYLLFIINCNFIELKLKNE